MHGPPRTTDPKTVGSKAEDAGSNQEVLACENLAWETPEGRVLFQGLDLALGAEKTALVGDNGVGKTTLVRLLVGELEPYAGKVHRQGHVAWLPQGIEARAGESIADALGVSACMEAMAAIEGGAYDDHLFEVVGERWDLPQRAEALLDGLGLPNLDFQLPIDRLSGGEAMRVALAGCLLAEPNLLVLDEPTNHLDTAARTVLYRILDRCRHGLLVISHDRSLLRRMERTLELSPLGLRSYGGGWDAYREQVRVEQEAARHDAEVAAARLNRQKRAVQEARERQARRAAGGKRAAARTGLSKLEIQAAKRQAQRTSGRLGKLHEQRIDEARKALETARDKVREREVVRPGIGECAVPTGKVVIEAEGVNMRWGEGPWLWTESGIALRLTGPARLALEGASGCGKSTLARILVGDLEPTRGRIHRGVDRLAWLDQRCRILPSGVPLREGMLQGNPDLSLREVYWSLDRFGLRREAGERPPETLSGGERMRAALAYLLGSGRPPRLLVLDEPTNNLDVSTVEVLEQALADYGGALIVISHDPDFVEALGVEERVGL